MPFFLLVIYLPTDSGTGLFHAQKRRNTNQTFTKRKENLIEQKQKTTHRRQITAIGSRTRKTRIYKAYRYDNLPGKSAFQPEQQGNRKRQNNPHDKKRNGGKGGDRMKKFTNTRFTSPPIYGKLMMLRMSRLPERSSL